MKALGFVVAASIALTAGCVLAHDEADQVPPSGAVRFDASRPAGLEVKRAKTGHLLVKPLINGTSPGWFIFDTGAGICVISTHFVSRTGLTAAGEIPATGVGGSAHAPLYRAASFALGPVTIADHVLMATDLSFLEQYLGEPIAGVIGFGTLNHVVAVVDLAGAHIELHDPAHYELKGASWTPLDLEGRIPSIVARFEDHEGLFKLDLGANMAVTFYEPAVRKWSLLEKRGLKDGKTGGVGGFVAVKMGTLRWIEFGGVRQESVPATFALEAKGTNAQADRAGQIGVPLLERFTLVFDYWNKRMAFRAREVSDNPKR